MKVSAPRFLRSTFVFRGNVLLPRLKRITVGSAPCLRGVGLFCDISSRGSALETRSTGGGYSAGRVCNGLLDWGYDRKSDLPYGLYLFFVHLFSP